MRYRIRTALFLALTLACGGGGTDATSGVTSISLTYAGTTVALGAVQTLGPVFRGPDGAAIGTVNGAQWTSSNPAFVSVDQSGQVTGVALGGPATITVNVGSATASASLTVIPDRINVTPSVATVPIGTIVNLTGVPLSATGAPIAASSAPVTWSSSDPSVATVGATTGTLLGVAAGFTRITATAAGKSTGFDIEVGTSSPFDGTWSGVTVAGSRPLIMVVLFGTVRSFRITYALFPAPYSPSCTRSVDASGTPNSPITLGQFSFALALPPTSQVSGTFNTANDVSGALTTTSLGTYSCNTLDNGAATPQVTYVATIPATNWTAARQ